MRGTRGGRYAAAMRYVLPLVLGLAAPGCFKPSAMAVCKKPEGAGVAASCRTDEPGGLGAAASEKVAFDLVDVPGQTGQGPEVRKARAAPSNGLELRGDEVACQAAHVRVRARAHFRQLNAKALEVDGQKTSEIVNRL